MARNKFDIDEDLQVKFNKKHIIRVLKYVKPYWKNILITIFLMIVSSIAGLLGPFITKVAIDSYLEPLTDGVPDGDAIRRSILGILLLSLLFLALLAVIGVCIKIRLRIMSETGQSIIHDLRLDLFNHLQELPFTYYDNRPHGKILVRVVNYVNSLSDLLSNGIVNVIIDSFSLVFILVFMLIIDVRLTLICTAGLPVLITAVMFIKNVQRRRSQRMSSKLSNLNAYIHESLNGIKVTQSFAREEVNLSIFERLNSDYRSAWISYIKSQIIMWPMIDNLSLISICLIYVIGVSWLDRGVTVGVLVAFVQYIWRFWQPIINLGNFYNQIITAVAYLERIFETLDEKPTVADMPGAIEMPEIKGDVEFRNVSFRYEENSNLVLDNISFKVNSGEAIALVGPTGAGKTTIVNLLSRFYDVTGGKVLIDGIDLRDVKLKSLRRQMGIMLQDTFIFSGTVMDNIRYGKLDASDEEVMEAAKAVKAHDFIMKMEEGYNTQVNERGTRLSVGQRQLISFARALLADPRILILDEATSSIDTETEVAVQAGLERLLKGRTSFIIAHRLSTIKNASKIFYIDNHRIIEVGNHEELMKKRGAYYELYMSQFKFLEAV